MSMDLATKREAEIVVGVVVNALEETRRSKLETDGFSVKLGGFGKFKVRHVSPTRRKIGFSGSVASHLPVGHQSVAFSERTAVTWKGPKYDRTSTCVLREEH
jgi:hypothetical protein